jgi:hypothetical protein
MYIISEDLRTVKEIRHYRLWTVIIFIVLNLFCNREFSFCGAVMVLVLKKYLVT